MLRRHFQILATLSAALLLAGHAQGAAAVGQAAPDFTLTSTSGKTVRLSDYRGKHVVLEWTNPGCPFVRKHYDSANMQGLQKEFTAKGVVWLAVNSTEEASADYLPPRQMAQWMVDQKAAPTTTLMDEDGKVGKAYGARTTPHMYLVDPQGTLIYAGGIDSIPSARVDDIKTATNFVRQGLGEALAGKPLSTPLSRPYGCSIKYKS
ncbi:MAG: thioredoxin family protein [Gammaproteobacteria bacterium]|nr:thioredoxin family protein [Gammaproteobacteria bacterium]MBU0785996.1 thioredoxin family protein [Gammaproteobacteria bacterium]MBU0816609.1 thioredoxin family protein [Gammaproteobacteria bacterium]MBU1788410.1 thioredoxin family protein [Gammaproteobacteria bacterium]